MSAAILTINTYHLPYPYLPTLLPIHLCIYLSIYHRETKCSNYTWSSRNYLTDQIIISRDYPCTAMLPSIYIAPDCDPLLSYQPATGSPVYIGVFGYSVAKFSLLVSPVGQQVQLLAGMNAAS